MVFLSPAAKLQDILIVVYVFLDAVTLAEVFRYFFLSCKANAKV